MILVLKGADFSGNNIGQVQVTTELDDFTKAAIVASGNQSMSDVTKSALNNLFLAMGVDGSNNVMSKLKYLFLPMIAGDLSKAFVNYKDNNFTVEATPDAEKFELRSHGFVAKSSNTTSAFYIHTDSPLLCNNFCSIFLRTEKMVTGVNDTTGPIVYRKSSKFLGPTQMSSNNNYSISLGSYGCNWGAYLTKSIDIIKTFGVNYSTTKYEYIFPNYVESENLPTITTDMTGETDITVYLVGVANPAYKPYGAIISGEALSTDEFKNIAAKVDALYATLL